ncbi:hypothetical protein BRW65_01145 [Mycobacterium paraffinicum]|uniref:SCP domain-containing protein n=1 Tax=Mycobacterium paraffinicum TaxID=53378 RepID=A0A1Q4I361_9MYCO|nr:hypothetical protein [Mycobacterium paraffinicum]OJZ76355.1 hypothetical protein BRW65_01145 [Mycobacterium paraffinicum]
MATIMLLGVGFAPAPSAGADATDNLRSAVDQVRAGTSCGALRGDPIIEKVATKINQSTQNYIDHQATQTPITDPLTGLKILGYRGTKATLLQGASTNDADSIKALILQGYNKIPDCAYTDFGANMQLNERTGYWLTAVVLAGA